MPFEESNFEKPDGVQIYAAGGEGMKAARTSPAAVEFFEACRSGDRCPPCPLLGVWQRLSGSLARSLTAGPRVAT